MICQPQVKEILYNIWDAFRFETRFTEHPKSSDFRQENILCSVTRLPWGFRLIQDSNMKNLNFWGDKERYIEGCLNRKDFRFVVQALKKFCSKVTSQMSIQMAVELTVSDVVGYGAHWAKYFGQYGRAPKWTAPKGWIAEATAEPIDKTPPSQAEWLWWNWRVDRQ